MQTRADETRPRTRAKKTAPKRPSKRSLKSAAKGRARKPRVIPGTWQKKFLAQLGEIPVVYMAADAAGVAVCAVYEARKRDPVFRKAWRQAIRRGLARAEAAGWSRATNGVLRPVYQGGKKVGSVREFSDDLLKFMIRAHLPKYRDRVDLSVVIRDQAKKLAKDLGLDPDEVLAEARRIASERSGS